MGVEFYLVNHSNKTIFDLGKWFTAKILDNERTGALSSDLHNIIKETFKDDSEYAQRVEDKIRKFSKDGKLEIVDDTGDYPWELEKDGYRIIGSRYENCTS